MTPPTPAVARAILEDAVPPIVFDHILRSGTLKVCSAVSPAAAAVLTSLGLPAYSAADTGGRSHVVNVIETSAGLFVLDLSAVQFCQTKDEGLDDIEEVLAEREELMARTAADPFSAVTLRPARPGEFSEASLRPPPPGDGPDGPLASFERAKKIVLAVQKDPGLYARKYARLYPYDFSRFGEAADPDRVLDVLGGRSPNPVEEVEEGEGEFYHVTSYASMTSIAEHGLRPRRGAAGTYQHGGYGEYSQGKIFLARGEDAALAWWGKVSDMLEYHHGDDQEPDRLVPVLLRVLVDLDVPAVDEVGSGDVPGSYFLEEAVEPDFLEFWNPDTQAWAGVDTWLDAPGPEAGVESRDTFEAEDEDEEPSVAYYVFGAYSPGGFKPSPGDSVAWALSS